MDKVAILGLIKDKLEGTDKFLVDMHISNDNRINVSIDGDNGITIDDCIELSRYIEKSLNRDEEDFELNVASAGLDNPLKLHRQYVKNIGRSLAITTNDGEKICGELLEVTDDDITILPDNTPRKKRKDPEQDNTQKILFNDIQTAKIIIKF
ncbi:MAG: ribosome assembly cofactor RimP [Bacteroidales bacterium]|nr:ribosome assembly cofactor RimP [Bacteroidales bacterium]